MTRPRVLVDLAGLARPTCGLGNFSQHLAAHLARQAADEFALTFRLPREHRGAFGPRVTYLHGLPWRARFDLWHASSQASGPPPGRIPLVLTLHDLFREQASPDRLKRLQRLVRRAAALTFVSGYTESVCRGLLELPAGLLTRVVPNGAELPAGVSPRRPDFLPPGDFLFCLGELRPRKKFEALPDLVARVPGVNLVIAGNRSCYPEYTRRIETRIRELGLQSRVFLPGPVSEAEKLYLYENCRAFLFPSRREGFGLPVIEAMRAGRPVFVLREASLPEVAGEHAHYWPSLEPRVMAEVLRQGLEGWSADKARRAVEHALRFRWEETVLGYLEVYRSALRLGLD